MTRKRDQDLMIFRCTLDPEQQAKGLPVLHSLSTAVALISMFLDVDVDVVKSGVDGLGSCFRGWPAKSTLELWGSTHAGLGRGGVSNVNDITADQGI